MTISFYSTTDHHGAFSNFAHYGIELDGPWWPTTEHSLQAHKFEDTGYQERMRTAATPQRAAERGRSRKMPLRSDWEYSKDDTMYRAVLKKVQPHPQLRDRLLGTGNEERIENAPGDYSWGCGKDGSGQDKRGRMLMRVRDRTYPAS